MQPTTAGRENYAPVYVYLVPILTRVARSHGYALALHGSLMFDIDLIAVPWEKTVSTAAELMAALCETLKIYTGHGKGGTSDIREHQIHPHGRKSWKLYLTSEVYIHLNVMEATDEH